MTIAEDLIHLLQSSASQSQLQVLAKAQEIAIKQNVHLHIVGGAIRDLLMTRPLNDLDFAVEGDAIEFSNMLAASLHGEVIMRSQFETCKVNALGVIVDIAMTRKEIYPFPGALPTVSRSEIAEDLLRRDFTINAIALRLVPKPIVVLDPNQGQSDINQGLVRILHQESFNDDPTRILRAIRYEQRLGFCLAPTTEEFLKRDLTQLAAITGERIRQELTLIFDEPRASNILLRAAELGILNAVYPHFPDSQTLRSSLSSLQHAGNSHSMPYLAALTHHMNQSQVQELAKRLNSPRTWTKVSTDIITARTRINKLSPSQRPSQVYKLLHDVGDEALQFGYLTAASNETKKIVRHYLKNWRYVRSKLNGQDLISLGVPEGPLVKEILELLLEAQLDGLVKTRNDEIGMVHKTINTAVDNKETTRDQ